jgi:ribosome maturation factor RimP
MQKTPLIKKIERLISPAVNDMGYELVRVLMLAEGSGSQTLQIMAEKPDGTMDVDDCEKISQAVSTILDVEDAVDEAYMLEISSPGIDRPLTRLKDFDKYKNNQVRVELSEPVGAQKKFKGLLKGLDGETIILETEDGETTRLPFNSVERAKIMLTDDVIRTVTSEDNRKRKAERKAERKASRDERKQKRLNKKTS